MSGDNGTQGTGERLFGAKLLRKMKADREAATKRAAKQAEDAKKAEEAARAEGDTAGAEEAKKERLEALSVMKELNAGVRELLKRLGE